MTTAVLIHGFSGSPASWRRVASSIEGAILAPAVCGHGVEPAAATFDAEVDRLAQVIRCAGPAPRFLAGYSLGGRLALGLLVRHPDLFCGAALIGANPGIGDEGARAARRHGDECWARRIEQDGLVAFDRDWSAQPLFLSQRGVASEALAEQRRIRLSHDPYALAAAMRVLGLGAMPDCRPALPCVVLPVDLIVGSLDRKFVGLAREMAEKLPDAAVRIVDGAGHNVPLEAPVELTRLLNAAIARACRGPL